MSQTNLCLRVYIKCRLNSMYEKCVWEATELWKLITVYGNRVSEFQMFYLMIMISTQQ
jgi:hypothetical protein